MPLVQLVAAAGEVDAGEHLVVQRDGAHLLVARGEELNEVVPVGLVLICGVAPAHLLQIVHILSELLQGGGGHVVGGEVGQLDRPGVELVHGGGGVGHRTHFIGVKLLPPVQRGGDVHGHHDLADEFPVVAARGAQAQGKGQVVIPQHVLALAVVGAVRAGPAVHGIAGAPHGVFQVHHADTFHLQHTINS